VDLAVESGSLLCRLSSLRNRGLLLRLLGHRYLLELDISAWLELSSDKKRRLRRLREQLCTGLRELQEGIAIMESSQPSSPRQERAVELLDVDAAVLHNLEARISKLSTLKQQFQCRAQDIV
jgi:hypothetical protein